MPSIFRARFAEAPAMLRSSLRFSAALSGSLLLGSVDPGAATAAPKVHTVLIDKMKFGPVPSGLRAGDVILWVNRDMFRHTATARDGSFNIDLPAGATGKTRLSRTGKIAFVCKYHPGMIGQLIVAR